MSIDRLSIREAENSDISHIADYWINSSSEHLTSMGVEISKLPSREDFTTMLSHQLSLPIRNRNSYCLIWEVNSVAIGHSNTNPTRYGEEAYFHTHIWSAGSRKSGYGSSLLKMSIERFFSELNLKKLVGEPFANNPAPNGLLKKLGFNFIKKYRSTPGSLSSEQLVNRWEMDSHTFIRLYK
jgi:RimJ/RimL family protein N-acetyltransferase